MKKILMFACLCLAVFAQAQNLKPDTLVMGPGYTNDVFYNVFNNQKKLATNTDWHLAFMIRPRTASIRINSGRGAKLYRVPNADISGFSSFDTTGWKSFPELHDNTSSWERDAFTSTAAGPSSPFDYGWGDYSQTSHHVVGDSLYIIELPGNIVKKLAIDSLLYDSIYVFRAANMDNTGMQTFRINKNMYQRKLFIYFSLTTEQEMDKEPIDSDWHLKFTRYTEKVPTGPGTFDWYPVIGGLSNLGVEVVKASGVDVANPLPSNPMFKRELNMVGSDWKSFDPNSNQWMLKDSLVYFVRSNRKNTADSVAISKIVFTGFGGATNGNIIINTGATSLGVSDAVSSITALGLYPNPAHDVAQLIFNSNENDNNARLSICNINGQIVDNQAISVRNGLNNMPINTSKLAGGFYLIKVETKGGNAGFKMIVNE